MRHKTKRRISSNLSYFLLLLLFFFVCLIVCVSRSSVRIRHTNTQTNVSLFDACAFYLLGCLLLLSLHCLVVCVSFIINFCDSKEEIVCPYVRFLFCNVMPFIDLGRWKLSCTFEFATSNPTNKVPLLSQQIDRERERQ